MNHLLKMKSKFLQATLIFMFMISVSIPMQVKAESSEVLLNMYGLSIGGPDRSSIGNEISSIKDSISGAETAKTFSDIENLFTKYHEEANKSKIASLNTNLDIILQQNLDITKDIRENFETPNIYDLLEKDKEYKTNIIRANNILADLDILNGITYSYDEFEYDFDGMEELLFSKKAEYETAKNTFELGDITNVKFPMDVERHVNSKYGNRIDPLNKSVTRFHSGTDYRAHNGTPLKALFNGVVTSCGWSDTSGYFIVVESGENIKTFVCHLSKILVQKGQHVNQYDIIGLTGGTGSRSTGPHLHIALYLNGATYDIDKLF